MASKILRRSGRADKEIREIKGFDGNYLISIDGSIWSRYVKGGQGSIGKFEKLKITYERYCTVNLSFNGKNKKYQVHALVLETFIGSCPKGSVCRHLDGDTSNNNVLNLKWGTSKENSEDMIAHGNNCPGEKNGFSKLTNESVLGIRDIHEFGNMYLREISKIYNISRTTIYDVIKKKTWRHI